MKIYTGIGSRETPPHTLLLMTRLATALTKHDYILRSGGADGADTAFEKGATHKEIFLPWNGFNNKQVDNISYFCPSETDEAREFVFDYHPAAHFLKRGAFSLMVRNTFQVLGADLRTPSDVLFCWTKDGGASGGTGQALRIAKDYKVEIINLYYPKHLDAWLTQNKIELA